MARENVEIIRQANDAFNQGWVAAARGFLAGDVEFHDPSEQPAPDDTRVLVLSLGGKVVRWEAFWNRQPLEAAGLSE